MRYKSVFIAVALVANSGMYSSVCLAQSLSEESAAAQENTQASIIQEPTVCLAQQQITARNATGEQTEDQIRALTRRIILKAIQIGKYNLQYRIEGTKQPKYRELRYGALQQASAVCGMTGSIISTHEFGANTNSPTSINRNQLRKAYNIGVIGSAIGGGSSALELSSNLLRSLRNRSRDYDPASVVRFMKAAFAELDELLAEREQLVSTLTDTETKRCLAAESRVMRQLRAYQLQSFLQHHCNMTEYRTNEDIFYLLNSGTGFLGVASAIYARKALTQNKFTGTSAVLAVTAGSIATAAPAVATLGAKFSKYRTRRKAEKALGRPDTFDAPKFEKDLEELKLTSGKDDTDLVRRIGIYVRAGDKLDASIQSETRVMREFNKVALQSNVLAPVIGGAFTASAITSLYAYYGVGRRATTLKQAKTVVRYNYAASVTSLSAGAFTVGTNGLLMALSLLYARKLEKEKNAPVMLLKDQLKYLDELEKQVQGP